MSKSVCPNCRRDVSSAQLAEMLLALSDGERERVLSAVKRSEPSGAIGRFAEDAEGGLVFVSGLRAETQAHELGV